MSRCHLVTYDQLPFRCTDPTILETFYTIKYVLTSTWFLKSRFPLVKNIGKSYATGPCEKIWKFVRDCDNIQIAKLYIVGTINGLLDPYMFPALGIFMCFVIVLGEVGPKTPPALWGVNSDEKPNSSCYFVDPPIYLDIGLLVVCFWVWCVGDKAQYREHIHILLKHILQIVSLVHLSISIESYKPIHRAVPNISNRS